MKVLPTPLDGVAVLEPQRFDDDRGWFREVWSSGRHAEAGLPPVFLQANVSMSRRGVLRGLHFQKPDEQGKLVSVLAGEIYDVAVDIRTGSPTFSRWYACTLSGGNGRQLWIPEGFAHGFLTLSAEAIVHYSCTVPYNAAHDRALAWDDPDIGIDWPTAPSLVSDKDRAAPRLRDLASLLAGPAAP
jgi:dTDP-4-dehydrorhamnose 3,5-epimerase